MKMQIFKQSGNLSCGINDDGDLFLGDNKSGFNLPDTPDYRDYILSLFEYEVNKRKESKHHKPKNEAR